jgi:glutamate dehydrogenase/leucine dehydrogenase
MIEYDEFGPEKIMTVYDTQTGMRGIVVIDNTTMGPGKGGIRMTSTVDTEEVAHLSRNMTWKCALAELPFGGAKAGIIADSREIGETKKRAVVEAFSRAIRVVCPELYVAAPDMYMSEQDMGWFAEANGDPRSCTGKPQSMGGLPHELGGAGFGVFHAARVAAGITGLALHKATFAVEGFGTLGRPAAQYLSEAGARFVAVSDSLGTIYKSDGLSFDTLTTLKQEGESVIKYAQLAGGEVCDLRACDHILDVDADILVTAARPNLIKHADVDRLHFQLIVQGSNLPMSWSVERACHKRGITVVPDFVANAGGIIASYVEYIGGGIQEMFVTIQDKVSRNTRIILEKSVKQNRMPRKYALGIARARVREAAGLNSLSG